MMRCDADGTPLRPTTRTKMSSFLSLIVVVRLIVHLTGVEVADKRAPNMSSVHCNSILHKHSTIVQEENRTYACFSEKSGVEPTIVAEASIDDPPAPTVSIQSLATQGRVSSHRRSSPPVISDDENHAFDSMPTKRHTAASEHKYVTDFANS